MVYKKERQRENGQHKIMTDPSVCWCALWLAVWEWQLVCVGWDVWAWLGEACENELMVEACIWDFHEKKVRKLVCSYPLSETNQRAARRREGAISTVYYKVSSAFYCQESCSKKYYTLYFVCECRTKTPRRSYPSHFTVNSLIFFINFLHSAGFALSFCLPLLYL